jgi:hypothetical protein
VAFSKRDCVGDGEVLSFLEYISHIRHSVEEGLPRGELQIIYAMKAIMGRKIFTNITVMPSHGYKRQGSYIIKEVCCVRDSEHALFESIAPATLWNATR